MTFKEGVVYVLTRDVANTRPDRRRRRDPLSGRPRGGGGQPRKSEEGHGWRRDPLHPSTALCRHRRRAVPMGVAPLFSVTGRTLSSVSEGRAPCAGLGSQDVGPRPEEPNVRVGSSPRHERRFGDQRERGSKCSLMMKPWTESFARPTAAVTSVRSGKGGKYPFALIYMQRLDLAGGYGGVYEAERLWGRLVDALEEEAPTVRGLVESMDAGGGLAIAALQRLVDDGVVPFDVAASAVRAENDLAIDRYEIASTVDEAGKFQVESRPSLAEARQVLARFGSGRISRRENVVEDEDAPGTFNFDLVEVEVRS